MNILLYDQDTDRLRSLTEALKKTVKDSYKLPSEPIFYIIDDGDVFIKKNYSKVTVETTEKVLNEKILNSLPDFSIAFIHWNDRPSASAKFLPKADFYIKYSGREGIDSDESKYGINTSFTEDSIKEAFINEKSDRTPLKDIILYALGKSDQLPTLLHPLKEKLLDESKYLNTNEVERKIKEIFSVSETERSKTQKVKALLLWSGLSKFYYEDKLIEALKSSLNIDIKSIEAISTEQELEGLNLLDEYELAIVNIDKAFEDRPYSDFSGLSAIEILRRKRYKGSVLAFTALPQHLKKISKQPKYKILKTNFNFLFNLENPEDDSNKSQLKSLQKILEMGLTSMSEENLKDIREHVLKRKGQLRDIFHGLPSKLEKKDAEVEVLMKLVFEEVEFLIPQKAKANYTIIKDAFLSKTEGYNEEFKAQLSSLEQKIKALIPEESANETSQGLKEASWDILLLEDDKRYANNIETQLKAYNLNVSKYHTVLDAEAALNSEKHRYRVAIVDIRLKDEDDNWQILQGYDFINRLPKSNKGLPLSVIALTRKIGYIIDSVKKKSIYKFKCFTKSDIETELGREEFIKSVINEGKSPIFIPKVNAWKNKGKHAYPLAYFYKKYWSDSRYYEWEKEINETVDKFIKWFQKDGKYDLNNLRPKGLYKSLKEYNNKGENLDFRNKLKARRIMVAACSFYWEDNRKRYNNSSDIHEILTGNIPDSFNSLFSQQLGIKCSKGMKLSADDLLIEERKYAVKINISTNPS